MSKSIRRCLMSCFRCRDRSPVENGHRLSFNAAVVAPAGRSVLDEEQVPLTSARTPESCPSSPATHRTGSTDRTDANGSTAAQQAPLTSPRTPVTSPSSPATYRTTLNDSTTEVNQTLTDANSSANLQANHHTTATYSTTGTYQTQAADTSAPICPPATDHTTMSDGTTEVNQALVLDANASPSSLATTTEVNTTTTEFNQTPITESSAATTEQAASRFAILAQDGGFKGLDQAMEGDWRGPFCFLQAADTQLGMMENFNADVVPDHWSKDDDTPTTQPPKKEPCWDKEVALMGRLVAAANRMRPRPRVLVVCGDLVDAFPSVACRRAQVRDFKVALTALHPSIKPVCVCGNHDLGDTPTEATVGQYRRDFGSDYFSFWLGGVKCLALNSQYYHDDSRTREHSEAQARWLDGQLTSEQTGWRHLIGFQHIPPFVVQRDEEPVLVFGNPKLFFNFGDKQTRFNFLDRLKAAGMSKLFCGHYHRNAGGWDDDLEVVVTSAVGCQLGADTHGCRLVVVNEHGVHHRYFALDDLPEHINLQSPFPLDEHHTDQQ